MEEKILKRIIGIIKRGVISVDKKTSQIKGEYLNPLITLKDKINFERNMIIARKKVVLSQDGWYDVAYSNGKKTNPNDYEIPIISFEGDHKVDKFLEIVELQGFRRVYIRTQENPILYDFQFLRGISIQTGADIWCEYESLIQSGNQENIKIFHSINKEIDRDLIGLQ